VAYVRETPNVHAPVNLTPVVSLYMMWLNTCGLSILKDM